MTDINTLFFLIIFFIGTCIGSFLNVCIYRIPEGKSIVYPGSACPVCHTDIPFYFNIPLISYLMLSGRCKYCKTRISLRYFLVELLTGFLAAVVFIRFDLTIEALFWFVFICVLIVISFIDFDHGIIPDVISLPGIIVFAGSVFFIPGMTVKNMLLGILAGGGILYLVAWGYYLLKKQEGMGGGDIKLLAMIGAAVGVKGVLVTIFLGSLIGTLAGVLIMIAMKVTDLKLKIPFGPFLSAGAVIFIFFGNELVNWYFNGYSLLR